MTRHMPASLDALCDDHVCPCFGGAHCGIHGSYLDDYSDIRLVRCRYELRRISPKERQGCYSFFDAHLNASTMRKVQQKIHAERLRCQLAHIANLFPQQLRRTKLCLHDAKTSGVADCSYELRSCKIGTQRRDHDWSVDAKPFA